MKTPTHIRSFLLSSAFRTASAVLVLFLSLSLPAKALSPQAQEIANYLTTSSGQQRGPMHLDPILTQVAQNIAQDMANRNFFADVNPDGHGPNYLVAQAGYKLPASWGNSTTANYIDSIAAGYGNPGDAWTGWMNSAPHKTHLLALNSFFTNQTSYGVGYYYNPNSTYQYYWVVITAPPQIVDLAITSPSNGTQVTADTTAIAGTTGSTVPAASVMFRVENSAGIGSFQAAAGTTAWSATVSGLVPGANTIRVRSYSSAGNQIAEETVEITYYSASPLTVATNGSGTITSGFAGTTTRGIGLTYNITAKPAAGYLFNGWTGDLTSASAALSFTMQANMSLQANFIQNPFLAAKGVYNGLTVSGSDSSATPFSLSLTTSGAFTGKFSFGGATYSLKGILDAQGNATVNVARRGATPLVATLSLDLSSDSLSVSITDGTTTSTVSTQQGVSAPTPLAGSYTVVIPPNQNGSTDAPQGNGVATITVGSKGAVRVVGSLADGTAFSQSAVITKGGNLPLFAALYSRKGSISGNLTFRSLSTSDVDGTVTWIKPASPTDKAYAAGFTVTASAVGSLYTKPTTQTVAKFNTLALTASPGSVNTVLELGEGGLAAAIDQQMTITNGKTVAIADPNVQKITLTLNSANGTFSGRFTNPVTNVATAFRGVLLQKQNAGFGWFMGAGQSGYATFGTN